MSDNNPSECERAGCDGDAEVAIRDHPMHFAAIPSEPPEDGEDSEWVCENCATEFGDRVSLEGSMPIDEFLDDERSEEWDRL